MYKKSTAPQMNSISAQIVPCTPKKSNSCLSFYGMVKKNDLLNLYTVEQINKVEWMT